jgi:hypothetical protein
MDEKIFAHNRPVAQHQESTLVHLGPPASHRRELGAWGQEALRPQRAADRQVPQPDHFPIHDGLGVVRSTAPGHPRQPEYSKYLNIPASALGESR